MKKNQNTNKNPDKYWFAAALTPPLAFAVGMSALALMDPGKDNNHETSHPPLQPGVEQVVFVPGTEMDGGKADVDALENWRKQHTGERIVSLTAIDDESHDKDGYQIVVKQGDNSQQSFDEIAGKDDSIGHGAPEDLDQWMSEHPDRDVTGIASITPYWYTRLYCSVWPS